MVVDGTAFWSRISPYRHGDWHFKDDINSNWGFLLEWESFLQELVELSIFAVPDRVWRFALNTLPDIELAAISLEVKIPDLI
eukprot:5519921-Lingulodinium_polyedra.AAC.1